MKRVLFVLTIFMLLILLFGCKNNQTTVEELPESTSIISENIDESNNSNEVKNSVLQDVSDKSLENENTKVDLVDFTLFNIEDLSYEQLNSIITKQGNQHTMNLSFCYDGNWIYGEYWDPNWEIVKVRNDGTEWTTLENSGYLGQCFDVLNGYLYYGVFNDKEEFDLYRMKTSGQDSILLISDINSGNKIQIFENNIYYTTEEDYDEEGNLLATSSHLYKCDLNGENNTCIIENPVYDFYVFSENILYQNDRDNESLYIYNIDTGEEFKVNDEPSYWPIYDGEYIYYLAGKDENYNHSLQRIKPDGTELKDLGIGDKVQGNILLIGDYIYYINADDAYRIYRCLKDGTKIELVTQDSNIHSMQIIDDKLLYVQWGGTEQDLYVEDIYICNFDGSGKYSFIYN